jgi:hypothetical protein
MTKDEWFVGQEWMKGTKDSMIVTETLSQVCQASHGMNRFTRGNLFNDTCRSLVIGYASNVQHAWPKPQCQ